MQYLCTTSQTNLFNLNFSEGSKASSENSSEKSTFKYPFLLNRSGIPLDEETWERLWAHAVSMYPHAKHEITAIKNMDNCDEVFVVDKLLNVIVC